jgi:predicted nucleic acid-binding protein
MKSPALVLDTDAVSHIHKQNTWGQLLTPIVTGRHLLISFQTLAELRRWPEERNWGEQRRQELEQTLGKYVIVHSTASICDRWAQTMNRVHKNGTHISAQDAWVAATALDLEVLLLTVNTTDFLVVPSLELEAHDANRWLIASSNLSYTMKFRRNENSSSFVQ